MCASTRVVSCQSTTGIHVNFLYRAALGLFVSAATISCQFCYDTIHKARDRGALWEGGDGFVNKRTCNFPLCYVVVSLSSIFAMSVFWKITHIFSNISHNAPTSQYGVVMHIWSDKFCTVIINITLFWLAVNTSRPVWGGHVIWLAYSVRHVGWVYGKQSAVIRISLDLTCIADGFYINGVHPSYHNKANGRQLNLISGPLLRPPSAGLGLMDWRSRPGRPIHVNMFHGQLKQLIISQSDKWSQVFS